MTINTSCDSYSSNAFTLSHQLENHKPDFHLPGAGQGILDDDSKMLLNDDHMENPALTTNNSLFTQPLVQKYNNPQSPSGAYFQQARPIGIPLNQKKVYPITYEFGFHPNIKNRKYQFDITFINLLSYIPIASIFVVALRIINIAKTIEYRSPNIAACAFTAIRIIPELLCLGSVFLIIDISLFVLRKCNIDV